MDYNEAKKQVFASGSQPDGYFGKRTQVEFALVNNQIISVCECGCFKTGLPDVNTISEAIWLLKHHPTAKYINITE
jgi:hypothetical protein